MRLSWSKAVPFTAFPCVCTAFHCLSLCVHCLSLPFLVCTLSFTAFPCVCTVFHCLSWCVHCLSLPFLVLEFTAVSFAEGGLGRKRVFWRRTPAGGGGRGAGGLDLLPAQTRVNPPHGTECSSALWLAACHETMARTSSQNAFGPGQRVVFVGQMHQMPHLHCLPALRIAAQRQ